MAKPLTLALALQAFVFPLTLSQTVSITTDPALRDVRQCVVRCVAGGDAWHAPLYSELDCGNSNSCFCQDRLRPQGSSYLSSCIFTDFSSCSEPDYSSAVSIYNRYCSFTGPATVSASATPTSENTDVNGEVTVTETTTPIITTTSVSSTSRPSECLVPLLLSFAAAAYLFSL